MQKVILTVTDDSRLDFFLELLRGLDYVDIETPEGFELSDIHKKILDERLARHEANFDEGSSWEEVKKRVLSSK